MPIFNQLGTYTLEAYAVDNVYNTGPITSQTFSITDACDITPPEVRIEVSADAYCKEAGTLGGDVIVDFSAIDDGMVRSAMDTEHTSLLGLLKDALIGKSYAAALPEGITEIYYRVNSGAWLQYSLVGPFTTDIPGEYLIEAYAIDDMYNQGGTTSTSFTISADCSDTIPPAVQYNYR